MSTVTEPHRADKLPLMQLARLGTVPQLSIHLDLSRVVGPISSDPDRQ
jgi:hypothetical protein